jgi:proline iminopeptidase
VPGGEVWYAIVGAGGGIPLVVLHGGPGFPHDYLGSLDALADERPVVFYDQLGCGRSDHPDDPALWRIERFGAELGQVRAALGLERVHLLGHSWGTMLATDYALTPPVGLASLVLASPLLSTARWLADQAAYRRQLPADVRCTLDRCEATGATDSREYAAAMAVYFGQHGCRLETGPEALQHSSGGMNPAVYQAMWGPNEFCVTGNLADYDRTSRLGELALPVLLTCGRYDQAAPATVAWYQSLLPDAELAVFEQSAHMPHLEEPERYLATIRGFLRQVEARARAM